MRPTLPNRSIPAFMFRPSTACFMLWFQLYVYVMCSKRQVQGLTTNVMLTHSASQHTQAVKAQSNDAQERGKGTPTLGTLARAHPALVLPHNIVAFLIICTMIFSEQGVVTFDTLIVTVKFLMM